MLDEQGRAMSKSLGNFIEPEEVISQSGAEVLRLWVAMLNFKEDTKFGNEIHQRLVEAYRKIRNTWRFILGNIHDFQPDRETVKQEDMLLLDRWIMHKTAEVGQRILRAYDEYEYHVIFHSIYNFFTVDLSSFYLDVLKDRLYCSAKNSLLRKSGQTALFHVLKNTLVLMAPILSFTAEEAWESMPAFKGKEESVHLETFPTFDEQWLEPDLRQEMDRLLAWREAVLKELEKAREEKLIGNSLEARVTLMVPPSDWNLAQQYEGDLASLFIVSCVVLEQGPGAELGVQVSRAPGEKCQRCWNYSTYVGKSSDYPQFCERCEDVVRKMSR
jgi:isoleucyl-tRNA synthetase